MNIKYRLALASLALALSPATFSQTSKEFAQMGNAFWEAFKCAGLADFLKDDKERERLFAIGYGQGKVFIDAYQKKKIDPKDVYDDVPMGVIKPLVGPSVDFMMGRIYESAKDDAQRPVLQSYGSKYPTDAEAAVIAKNHYAKKNCRLIRAGK